MDEPILHENTSLEMTGGLFDLKIKSIIMIRIDIEIVPPQKVRTD